jgi:hypothetical protein
MRSLRFLAPVVAVGLALTVSATRFDDYTKRFQKTPDQAKMLSAGCLGGPGTEWFCGGGFQADGTVVLAGTALGPTLSLAGVEAKPLGTDLAQPGDPKIGVDAKGKPNKPSWAHANATAFVALVSADFKTVKSVVRFPWMAASATSAVVDAQGGIYLAGIATDQIAALTADAKNLPVDVEAIGSKLTQRKVYLAKLAPDASKVLWVRTMTGPSAAPSVSLGKDGKLRFQSADIRVFDTNGALVTTAIIPGGLSTKNAVNPVDGTFAYGGEHHWPTGREPWRCPVLKIYQPDGKLKHQLYDWGGPFVGAGELRLVSDTAIRNVAYDSDGNLVFTAWSDGGNSPALREPMDIYKSTTAKGLGWSAWGAGVGSFAYVVKLDAKTYRIKDATFWATYLPARDKPNGIGISAVSFATDGSVCIGGGSATGLIATGNHLLPATKPGPNPGDPEVPTTPGGPYVTIFNKDLTSLRFSSVLLGCGAADIANDDDWTFVSGTVQGKPMVLILTGAAEKDSSYNGGLKPVAKDALQPAFGGGVTDGYMVALDLSMPEAK